MHESIFTSPEAAVRFPSQSQEKLGHGKDAAASRRGGGGAWRAFLREIHCMSSAEAARRYRDISEDAKARLIAVGKAATLLHQQTGNHGFGGSQSPSVQAAHLRKNLHQQALEEYASANVSDNLVCVSARNLSEKLTVVRSLCRSQSRLANQEEAR